MKREEEEEEKEGMNGQEKLPMLWQRCKTVSSTKFVQAGKPRRRSRLLFRK